MACTKCSHDPVDLDSKQFLVFYLSPLLQAPVVVNIRNRTADNRKVDCCLLIDVFRVEPTWTTASSYAKDDVVTGFTLHRSCIIHVYT